MAKKETRAKEKAGEEGADKGEKKPQFMKYTPGLMDSLQAQFSDNYTEARRFSSDAFHNAQAVIDYAYTKVGEKYKWRPTSLEIETEKPIGYSSTIRLDEIPEGADVQEQDVGGYKIKVVTRLPEGFQRQRTNKITVEMGPIQDNIHGFHAIYAGERAMPPPQSEEALRQELENKGYQGSALDKALEAAKEMNQASIKFWQEHALIKEGGLEEKALAASIIAIGGFALGLLLLNPSFNGFVTASLDLTPKTSNWISWFFIALGIVGSVLYFRKK